MIFKSKYFWQGMREGIVMGHMLLLVLPVVLIAAIPVSFITAYVVVKVWAEELTKKEII